MRALTLHAIEGLSGVALADVAHPAPGPGEVRVALRAAALNHRDLWITVGQYPGIELPARLGADGAGVIDSVGEGVDAGLIGTPVVVYPGLDWGPNPLVPARSFALMGMPGPGTIAEAVCVPADRIAPRPGHLTFAEAAALSLAGLTAWRALTTKAGLQPGETLLLTGVGGGVSSIALKFGLALGAKVFVTSGSDATLERALALGAAGGFNYRSEGWARALAEQSGGIDVVVDGAPGQGFALYRRALAMGARVVVYGATGGAAIDLSATDLFLKNITLVGTNVGNVDEFRAMYAFIDRHRIAPVIDRAFAFDEAVAALAYLRDEHGFGKVVIDIPQAGRAVA